MKEILGNLKRSRVELGINYQKITLQEINLKGLKKIIERNEEYDLTDKELLDRFETTPIYRYTSYKTGKIIDATIIVEGIEIGKVKPSKKEQLDGKIVECTMYGGNYKRINLKDDEPVSITLIHSTNYYLIVEIESNQL